MTTQPEALRLASQLESGDIHECAWQAAAELRRMHEAYEALLNDYHGVLETLDEMQATVAAEREACAKVADRIAAAIRARGNNAN